MSEKQQTGSTPATVSFGEWLRSQPPEPHLVPVGQVDNWPERMLRAYARAMSHRETDQLDIFEVVA